MRSIRFWCSLLVATFVASSAGATIIPAFPLRQLVVDAHDIVRGQVVDQRSVYDPRRDRIYTHTVIRVDEVLGRPASSSPYLTVRQLGGVIGDRESRVVGTASLEVSSEVVLFTRTDGTYHYLVGMAQGAYQVISSPDGTPRLTRGADGMTRMVRPGPAAPAAPDRMSLHELRMWVSQVRSRP